MKKVLFKELKTPAGEMIVGATDEGLCLFDFARRRMSESIRQRIETRLNAVFVEGHSDFFSLLCAQLDEYFDGARTAFDVPLVTTGTEFEEEVWRELRNIPFGEVRTYKEQAQALSKPGAVRAVARANGANCLAILIPCHRVIGSDGSLTGYAGGLSVKKRLLNLEEQTAGASQMTLFDSPRSTNA